MELLPKHFTELVNSLRILPGVGPRTAQRMALYLLDASKRDQARVMAQSVTDALENIDHCQQCRNYTDQPICELCTNEMRDDSLLCVVETPADLIAIESSRSYKGRYFVLMGKLSPLDGIGPKELGFDLLFSRVQDSQPSEIILALSATIEGEATSHSLSEKLASPGRKVSRIAQGIPSGGNLEYLDTRTLIHAIDDRKLAMPE